MPSRPCPPGTHTRVAVAQGEDPCARFEVLPEEGHRPFVEAAEQFNARVDAFWREVDKRD